MATAGISVGDSRSPRASPRGYMESTVQESNKHLAKREKMRRLQSARGPSHSKGWQKANEVFDVMSPELEVKQMLSRRATASPRRPTTSNSKSGVIGLSSPWRTDEVDCLLDVYSAVHTSAPPERERFRPEGLTVRDRAASKLKQRQDLKHALGVSRETSPKSHRPSSRNSSRTTSTTASSVVPDYSALSVSPPFPVTHLSFSLFLDRIVAICDAARQQGPSER